MLEIANDTDQAPIGLLPARLQLMTQLATIAMWRCRKCRDDSGEPAAAPPGEAVKA